MRLILLSLVKEREGTICITVVVEQDKSNNRIRAYHLPAKNDSVGEFLRLYHAGEDLHNEALDVLVNNDADGENKSKGTEV